MEPVNLGGQAMLVLSRNIGDKIIIGQQIVVTVLGGVRASTTRSRGWAVITFFPTTIYGWAR